MILLSLAVNLTRVVFNLPERAVSVVGMNSVLAAATVALEDHVFEHDVDLERLQRVVPVDCIHLE